MKRILTGIQPTGVPHLGNCLGAIRPAIEAAARGDVEQFLFIADLHALTNRPEPEKIQEDIRSVAASWLAFGLDPERAVFYRQSDVPEVTKLAWILGCSLNLGLLMRAHSYKDTKAKGTAAEDVSFGLFSYPVLMAADILLFDADVVPVGKDQKQHLEITQEAARKFNLRYGEVLKVPEAQIDQRLMVVPGLDGRKMSKSYGNTIEVFAGEKPLWKKIRNIKTDSTEFGEPLDPEGDLIFELHGLVATPEVHAKLEAQYRSGRKDPGGASASENFFGWGDAKKALHRRLVEDFAEERATYEALMADPARLDQLLAEGAARARPVAKAVLDRVERAIGITRTD